MGAQNLVSDEYLALLTDYRRLVVELKVVEQRLKHDVRDADEDVLLLRVVEGLAARQQLIDRTRTAVRFRRGLPYRSRRRGQLIFQSGTLLLPTCFCLCDWSSSRCAMLTGLEVVEVLEVSPRGEWRARVSGEVAALLVQLEHLREPVLELVHRPELLALHQRFAIRSGRRRRLLLEVGARAGRRRTPLRPVVHEHEDRGLAGVRRSGRGRESGRGTRWLACRSARVQVRERHLQRHLILDGDPNSRTTHLAWRTLCCTDESNFL